MNRPTAANNKAGAGAGDKEKGLPQVDSDEASETTQIASREAGKPGGETGVPVRDRAMGDNAPKSGLNGKPVSDKEAAGAALEESVPL